MSDDVQPAKWRSWPKVSPARSGAANTKRYTGKRVEGTEVLGECWWCSEPATRLCDTTIIPSGERLHDGTTCDAHLCDGCTDASIVHFAYDCGRFDEDGEPIGRTETDSIDACPYCQVHAGWRGRGRHAWNERTMVKSNLWRERVRAHAAKRKNR